MAHVVVERDHVPAAEIEAVVALPALTRRPGAVLRAVEVVEVSRRIRVVVLVVAGQRTRLVLERAPRRRVPRRVVRRRAVGVGVVARRQRDVGIDRLDDLRGPGVAAAVVRDVARGRHNGVSRGGRRRAGLPASQHESRPAASRLAAREADRARGRGHGERHVDPAMARPADESRGVEGHPRALREAPGPIDGSAEARPAPPGQPALRPAAGAHGPQDDDGAAGPRGRAEAQGGLPDRGGRLPGEPEAQERHAPCPAGRHAEPPLSPLRAPRLVAPGRCVRDGADADGGGARIGDAGRRARDRRHEHACAYGPRHVAATRHRSAPAVAEVRLSALPCHGRYSTTGRPAAWSSAPLSRQGDRA
jgi:hypothetical protein